MTSWQDTDPSPACGWSRSWGGLLTFALAAPTASSGLFEDPGRADLVAESIRFRESVGLAHDLGSVAYAIALPGADTTYGVPLTGGELLQVAERVQRQIAVDPAAEAFHEHPDYAGTFMDGNTPVMLFAANVNANEADVRAMLPDDVVLEVRSAVHSYPDLLALQSEIWADKEIIEGQGIDLVASGIRASSNKLRVGVADLTEQATTTLTQTYGDAIVVYEQEPVELDSCSVDSCWAPTSSQERTKGGLKLSVGSDTSVHCTTGFVAHKNNGSDWLVLTAGHCVEGITAKFKHAGNNVGDGGVETWANGANADAGIIVLDNAPDVDNLLLVKSSNGDLRNVTGVMGNGEQNGDDVVCRMGAGSPVLGQPAMRCGEIDDDNATHDVNGKTINYLKRTNFDSCPGDSGGAVYQDPYDPNISTMKAIGTHADSSNGCNSGSGYHSWYSPVNRSIATLEAVHDVEIYICTTINECP